jgi:hypothetical protein
MKKLLFALISVTCFLSCEGPMGPPGEQTQWHDAYYTVRTDDWKLVGRPDEIGSFYQYSFIEPALTEFIYEKGVVMGYVVANPGIRDEVLRPLPDTWPIGEGYDAWLESITFDYRPGLVTFYVGYSDFATSVRPPDMTFKLMMIW